MKKTILYAVSVAVILFFSGSATFAQHMGRGMMGRGGYGMGPDTNYGEWNRMNLEQQREWKKMRIEFWKETLPLRQKMMAKQMELSILWQEETPDPDKAEDLSDEISDLQSKLLKKRNKFLIECRGKFGDQGWSCPGSGSGMMGGGYGMGPGMMGRGYGMGHGMMGRGYGMSPGMMGRGYGMGPGGMHWGRGAGPYYGLRDDPRYQGPGYRRSQKPLDEDDAKELLKKYIESARNPNLRLGDIDDEGDDFEAEILTKDGSLVDKVLVDKKTGWMRSAY